MILKKIGSIFVGGANRHAARTHSRPGIFDEDFPEFTPTDCGHQLGDEKFQSRFWQDSIHQWMGHLDEPLRPTALVERYPRIAAKLMTHWLEQSALEHYLDTLVTDRRQSRQGFPAPIKEELLRLQSFVVQRRQPRGPDLELAKTEL